MIRTLTARMARPLAALATLVSCAGGTTQLQLPESAVTPTGPLEHVPEAAEERAPSEPRLPSPPSPLPRAPLPPSPKLENFLAGLAELRQGQRARHLRIGFLGDSHIQADFWTGAVRRALQQQLGDGGLGFVHIGWPGYRHDGVRIERTGPFRTEPQPMTTGERQGDGIYGLGGVRVVFEAESRAMLQVEGGPARELHFDLAYRLPTCPAKVRLNIQEGPASARKAESRLLVCTEADRAGPIEHLDFVTGGEAPSLEVEVVEGELELFGLTLEAALPGVVVDALGIAGARADTPLAWDREAFTGEISRRDYDLLVVAYGTNDSVPPSPAAVPAFGRNLSRLLGRLREGANVGDCLIIGPMDRGPLKRRKVAPEERILELNEEAARVAMEQRCAFFSAIEAMGGMGAMRAWAEEKPPLAQRDLVHLTRAGYARLGELLTDFLIAGPSAFPPSAFSPLESAR